VALPLAKFRNISGTLVEAMNMKSKGILIFWHFLYLGVLIKIERVELSKI